MPDLPIYYGLPYIRVESVGNRAQPDSWILVDQGSSSRLQDKDTLLFTKARFVRSDASGEVHTLVEFEIPSGQWSMFDEGNATVVYKPNTDLVHVFMGRVRLHKDLYVTEPDQDYPIIHVRSKTHARIGNAIFPNRATIENVPKFEDPSSPDTSSTSQPSSALPTNTPSDLPSDLPTKPDTDYSNFPDYDETTTDRYQTMDVTLPEDKPASSESVPTVSRQPVPPVLPPRKPTPTTRPTRAPAKGRRKNKGFMVGIIVIVVVIVVTVIAIIVVAYNRFKKERKEPTSSS